MWGQAHKLRGLKFFKQISFHQLATVVSPAVSPHVPWLTPARVQPLSTSSVHTYQAARWPKLHDKIVLTTAQRREWMANYQMLANDFETFKKNSSTFLFYQSMPSESRILSQEEKCQWLEQMVPLYKRLLDFYPSTQQDEFLVRALNYMETSISLIDPYLVPRLRLQAQPATHFNMQEFLLYPPAEQLGDPSIDLDGKNIVLINDDGALLSYFERLVHMGVLLPGANVRTYGEPLHFLLKLAHTSSMPDIIFTDMQLGTSNGYYLASQLRKMGYTGGLIALTSYAETEDNARMLKSGGFDGLVSLDDRYYQRISFVERLTRAAQLYLLRIQHK